MGSSTSGGRGGPLATVTHAKLRAAQGDVAAARKIARAILEADPDHEEAKALLRSLEGAKDGIAEAEGEEPARAPEAGDLRELTARFREVLSARGGRIPADRVIARFKTLLDRIAEDRRNHAR